MGPNHRSACTVGKRRLKKTYETVALYVKQFMETKSRNLDVVRIVALGPRFRPRFVFGRKPKRAVDLDAVGSMESGDRHFFNS